MKAIRLNLDVKTRKLLERRVIALESHPAAVASLEKKFAAGRLRIYGDMGGDVFIDSTGVLMLESSSDGAHSIATEVDAISALADTAALIPEFAQFLPARPPHAPRPRGPDRGPPPRDLDVLTTRAQGPSPAATCRDATPDEGGRSRWEAEADRVSAWPPACQRQRDAGPMDTDSRPRRPSLMDNGGPMLTTSRDALTDALRSYGEEEAAARVSELSHEEFQAIERRAWEILSSAQAPRYIATAIALAGVQLLLGRSELKRKRRILKGIYPKRVPAKRVPRAPGEKTLAQKVEAALELRLEAAGWRITRGSLLRDLGTDVEGWLGIFVHGSGDLATVIVNVGVHCRPLENQFYDEAGVARQRYATAALCESLCALDPSIPNVSKIDRNDVERGVERIATDIETFGHPFIAKLGNRTGLLEALRAAARKRANDQIERKIRILEGLNRVG